VKSEKIWLITAAVAALFCITIIAGSVVSAAEKEQVVQIMAKKFEFSPKEIKVKKGIPVVLEFRSLDRLHGFNCPGLGIRSDIPPDKVTTLRFVPQRVGTFPFYCDNFCGSGHEGMTGTIIVTE
jgi:cytochrome c oxidase subunit 2